MSMFLDERTVWPRRDDPPPPPRKPLTPRQARTMARVLLGYALFLLLAPISVTGFGDAVHYVIALFG